MSGFALQTSTGDLVGFLLLAGNESLAMGDRERHCVLLSAPTDAAVIEHELNVFLTENRATEFRCHLIQQADSWQATVDVRADCRVYLNCSGDGIGEWRVENFARICCGLCKIIGQ